MADLQHVEQYELVFNNEVEYWEKRLRNLKPGENRLYFILSIANAKKARKHGRTSTYQDN